jgi:hypothetical protein
MKIGKWVSEGKERQSEDLKSKAIIDECKTPPFRESRAESEKRSDHGFERSEVLQILYMARERISYRKTQVSHLLCWREQRLGKTTVKSINFNTSAGSLPPEFGFLGMSLTLGGSAYPQIRIFAHMDCIRVVCLLHAVGMNHMFQD